MSHPLDAPENKELLMSAIREAAAGKTWGEWFIDMAEWDAWDDICKLLPFYSELQAVWDIEGMFPDETTLDVFRKVELEIFGRTVDAEL